MSSEIHMARQGRRRDASSNARSQWRQMSQHLGEPSAAVEDPKVEEEEEVVAIDATAPTKTDITSSVHLRSPTMNSVRARFAQIDWEGRAPEVTATVTKVAPARVLQADTRGMSVSERFLCVPWEGVIEAQEVAPSLDLEALEERAVAHSSELTVTNFFKDVTW